MDESNDPLGVRTGARTEALVPVDTATSVRQKRKPMKLKSSVWSHFDRFKNEQGETRARCKYCHKDYSGEGANGTSGLTADLRTCKDMYGGVVGGEIGNDLEETLSKMFNEYKIKMGLNNDVGGNENMHQENEGPVHPSLRLRLQFERDSGIVSHGVGCSDLEEYLSENPKIFTDDFDI
ncbi:hypothetical protein POM88_046440 [Heracleum sosnowskyi]|uniref:BED-type domain-containing protein n=1 Tax=Heracleum sosnowskyi TaxID=360622 RepID=A0AAD8M611_9APIA|nr:hypothetical protein POM88_046440 [Heracleum sosnowskyi]